MSHRPLVYDLVQVTYEDPEGRFAFDEPAIIETAWLDGWYEILFLQDTAFDVHGQYLRPISLNDLTPEQVEVARQIKNKLLDYFAREVSAGHLVRHADGALLVLGAEIDLDTFEAIDLNTKAERVLKSEDCRRVLLFDLPFDLHLEFEALSQALNDRAGRMMLANSLYAIEIDIISARLEVGEPDWERARGELEHRLYVRFPEFAEREFRAQQDIDQKYALVDGHLFFLEDWLDEEPDSSE